jgi:hypothetical protein
MLDAKTVVYYQPDLTDEEYLEHNLATYEVFNSYHNAKESFPDHNILAFTGDDIEAHIYVDTPPSFVVTYDIGTEDAPEETYYGIFVSPAEAKFMFSKLNPVVERKNPIIFQYFEKI